MSIVGTRPPLISETNLYELHHRARLAIKGWRWAAGRDPVNYLDLNKFVEKTDLREQKGEKSIDETFRKSDVANDKERKAKNWTTQLKEYDADSFAITIQAVLFLQQW